MFSDNNLMFSPNPPNPVLRRLLAPLCFFVAFAILRYSIALFLEVDLHSALNLGLMAGWMSDFAFSLMIVALALVVASLNRRLAVFFTVVLAFSLWLAVFSNLSYFRFFRFQLPLWMISHGAQNIWSIRKSIQVFISDPWALSSLFLVGLGCLLTARLNIPSSLLMGWSSRVKRASLGVALVISCLLIRQSPQWMQLPRVENSVVGEHVATVWWKEISKKGLKAFEQSQNYGDVIDSASSWLHAYAQSDGNIWPAQVLSMQDHGIGLAHDFAPDAGHVNELRKEFGLANDGKTNVILLFLESARSFEFLQPEIGPQIYPNLHRVLSEHGVLFKEAYSSAVITVSGQYATLCSDLNRMEGPAEYMSRPNLDATCLEGVFKDRGYETYWMNPYHRFFNGKYLFEFNHGMQHFLDREFFTQKTPEDAINASEWGIADHPFLNQAFDELEKIHGGSKPFFVHLLTTGTHAPWNREVAGFELPQALAAKENATPDYRGYLLEARALDSALGEFFARFFASDMAKDTIVFLISDHGVSVPPGYPKLSSLQTGMILPRILFAAVSKDMKNPRVVDYPVHQIDMAPWIATVADLKGSVTWLGRDPSLGQGSPWVAEYGLRLAYRTRDRLCAELPESPQMQCWGLEGGHDPLLDATLPSVTESPEVTANFLRVVHANEYLTENGSLVNLPLVGQGANPHAPLAPTRSSIDAKLIPDENSD